MFAHEDCNQQMTCTLKNWVSTAPKGSGLKLDRNWRRTEYPPVTGEGAKAEPLVTVGGRHLWGLISPARPGRHQLGTLSEWWHSRNPDSWPTGPPGLLANCRWWAQPRGASPRDRAARQGREWPPARVGSIVPQGWIPRYGENSSPGSALGWSGGNTGPRKNRRQPVTDRWKHRRRVKSLQPFSLYHTHPKRGVRVQSVPF